MDENRVFIINSADLNDSARYTCIGTNIAGELSNHIELQIFSMTNCLFNRFLLSINLVPPTIQREPNEDNVSVIQHHHIALTCTANGWNSTKKIVFEESIFFLGDPWPSVSWEKDGLPIDTSRSGYRLGEKLREDF